MKLPLQQFIIEERSYSANIDALIVVYKFPNNYGIEVFRTGLIDAQGCVCYHILVVKFEEDGQRWWSTRVLDCYLGTPVLITEEKAAAFICKVYRMSMIVTGGGLLNERS